MTPRRAKRPRVATSSPLETSGGCIAAPSSPQNSAPAQKTTMRSKEPLEGCLRCCLARTIGRSFGEGATCVVAYLCPSTPVVHQPTRTTANDRGCFRKEKCHFAG